MTPDSKTWVRLQTVFEKATSIPEDLRGDYLQQACAGNESMRAEVEGLLASWEPAESELEDAFIPFAKPSGAFQPPSTEDIAGYQILQELYRGGQGVVYKAIQLSTKREVALKFMIAGSLAGVTDKRRFQREVELVSALRHPGIVPVFDSGLAEGKYFYAMDFIDGMALDEFVRDRDLSSREILTLFVQICDAVNYAHQNGVIHRDLKPSNILVDLQLRPHVLDFGLAKIHTHSPQDTASLSITGQVMGTLAYMSPEQASGNISQTDTRSDVYSLGVVLYQLLTGTMPYELDFSLAENLATIKHAEPSTLALRASRVGGEVSTIVLKSLQKDRDRRYQTAGGLGDDIDRYLHGLPIEAKRDSAHYVIRKMLARNLTSAIVVSSFLGLILASAVVFFSLYLSADRARYAEQRATARYRFERDVAVELRQQSVRQHYFAEMNFAGQEMQNPGGVGQVRQILKRWAPDEAAIDLRGWEWYRMAAFCSRERLILKRHQATVWAVDWSPDGKRVASSSVDDNAIRIWDAVSGKQVGIIETLAGRWVDWSPDGQRIASSSFGGTVLIWDAISGEQIFALSGHLEGTTSRCVDWSPNGSQLASTSNDGELIIWDTTTGTKLKHINVGDAEVASVSWNPDGNRVAIACGERTQVWNPGTGEQIWNVHWNCGRIESVAWSPDGALIATAACDRVRISDATTGDELDIHQKDPGGKIWSLSWSPDSTQVVTAHGDRMLRIVNVQSGAVQSGTVQQVLVGHEEPILCVQWSPKGDQIVSTGVDRTVRLWDIETLDQTCTLETNHVFASSIDWSSDGRSLASSGQDWRISIWELSSGQLSRTLEAGHEFDATSAIRSIQWSPDDTRIATAGHDNTVRIWDSNTGKLAATLLGHDRRVVSVNWHPDGNRLASGDVGGITKIWDIALDKELATFPGNESIRALQWSPDGTRLASLAADHAGRFVTIRSTDGMQVEQTLRGHTERIRSICWSPDGTQLATASNDGTLRLWDVATGNMIGQPMQHSGYVTSVDWSPDLDKPRICTATNAGAVHIWDPADAKLALTLKTPTLTVSQAIWSPDGKTIAASCGGQIFIWDATTGYESRVSKGR